MGRLAGFPYREVVRRLRSVGFQFDRQGPGSHEVWRHSQSGRSHHPASHGRYGRGGILRAILREAGIDVGASSGRNQVFLFAIFDPRGKIET